MTREHIEIERKFRVRGDAWRDDLPGVPIRQGYLARTSNGVVRVRIAGDEAFLTIKGRQRGWTRSEFEYPIPAPDARLLLELCEEPPLEKTRYRIEHAGHTWEIDVFAGDNRGLVLAEIELEHEGEHFERPDWLANEVSTDPRYHNSNLCHTAWRSEWESEPSA